MQCAQVGEIWAPKACRDRCEQMKPSDRLLLGSVAINLHFNISEVADERNELAFCPESEPLMVHPENVAPPRSLAGELRKDPPNIQVPTALRAASRILHAALHDRTVASTGDGDRDDDKAPRRAPTMWR